MTLSEAVSADPQLRLAISEVKREEVEITTITSFPVDRITVEVLRIGKQPAMGLVLKSGRVILDPFTPVGSAKLLSVVKKLSFANLCVARWARAYSQEK